MGEKFEIYSGNNFKLEMKNFQNFKPNKEKKMELKNIFMYEDWYRRIGVTNEEFTGKEATH